MVGIVRVRVCDLWQRRITQQHLPLHASHLSLGSLDVAMQTPWEISSQETSHLLGMSLSRSAGFILAKQTQLLLLKTGQQEAAASPPIGCYVWAFTAAL